MYYVKRDGEEDTPYFEIGKCVVEPSSSLDWMVKCTTSRSSFVISEECVFDTIEKAVVFVSTNNPENLPVLFA